MRVVPCDFEPFSTEYVSGYKVKLHILLVYRESRFETYSFLRLCELCDNVELLKDLDIPFYTHGIDLYVTPKGSLSQLYNLIHNYVSSSQTD